MKEVFVRRDTASTVVSLLSIILVSFCSFKNIRAFVEQSSMFGKNVQILPPLMKASYWANVPSYVSGNSV